MQVMKLLPSRQRGGYVCKQNHSHFSASGQTSLQSNYREKHNWMEKKTQPIKV